ncbi:alpha/beta hydrolase family protein [Tessaracoccus flavescens]|uniref:alpha/beta hydrolase family protein n=1 Tax=Tessaracoccus flavescens TaxID=399497 RepID=UPI0015CF8717|nr:alpha/beta hydrolase fold domain-containing protein [Tessaracoccus flavescens]
MAPGVVERVRGLALVNISDLVERLPQRAHARGQITDHPVHLGGLIEAPARVREAAQGFGRLGSVGSRIEERRHGDDEAIEYAIRRGAQQIVLFGWSMGAAITLQIAARPRHQGLIAAQVLDSPVLNWTEVIKTNCARSGLPAAAGYLAIPWLTMTRSLAPSAYRGASRSDPSTGRHEPQNSPRRP